MLMRLKSGNHKSAMNENSMRTSIPKNRFARLTSAIISKITGDQEAKADHTYKHSNSVMPLKNS